MPFPGNLYCLVGFRHIIQKRVERFPRLGERGVSPGERGVSPEGNKQLLIFIFRIRKPALDLVYPSLHAFFV